MNVKIISDTHNEHSTLGRLNDLSCDVLIHSGDATTKGNYTEGLSFLWWFVKQPAKYKILVPGNHDRKIKTHSELISLARDMGIIVLKDDLLELNGLRIYGACRTFGSHDKDNPVDSSMPEPMQQYVLKRRAEAAAQKKAERVEAWKNIPEGLDLLVTHMPPFNILDENLEGEPCGCIELRNKVLKVKPKIHVFGHIHEQGGKSLSNGDTKFYNCACMNRQYILVRGYHELSISPRTK